MKRVRYMLDSGLLIIKLKSNHAARQTKKLTTICVLKDQESLLKIQPAK